MSARQKQKPYKPQPFESVGQYFTDRNGNVRSDTFATISESMLLDDNFQSLKLRQKMLYIICKAQYFGKRKPKRDYAEVGKYQSEDYFYLNKANVMNYGLYTSNMSKEFYSDMKILEEHGFIECVEKGGYGGKKSVYKFSPKWKSQ